MPGDFSNYLHHSKFLEYIRMYADHFQLEQYIRYEVEVMCVEPEQTGDGGEGRWTLTTRQQSNSNDDCTCDYDTLTTQRFDAVIVCAGINSYVNMPTFDGQHQFRGQLIHNTNYR